MITTGTKWIYASPERRRIYAEEEFILDVAEKIWKLLDEHEWTRSDLANALDTSRANVTQMLNGSRNMTLRTLARIAYILNTEVYVNFGGKESVGQWQDVADALMLRPKAVEEGSIHTQELRLQYQTGAANVDWQDIGYRNIA